MLKSRALTGALIVGAVAVASMFAASPASAATLPAGQKITVIDEYETLFFAANPADAALTVDGPDAAIDGCVQGIDVDDSGLGWAVESANPFFSYSSNCANGDAITAGLWKADANTGLITDGVQIRIFFGDVTEDADECSAIDYSGGIITAACIIFAGDAEIPVTYVGQIDPLTGTMVPDFWFGEFEGPEFVYITAIAIDPLTGTLYAFTVDDGSGFTLLTLSETEGVDYVGSLTDPVWGADFDRDGKLWATTQSPDDDPALAVVNLSAGPFPFYEFYTLDGELYVDASDGGWIEALTVWGVAPAAQLAATGSTASPLMPIGAAAVLLLGALLAAGAAMRRRTIATP
jgi:hypothetical protein